MSKFAMHTTIRSLPTPIAFPRYLYVSQNFYKTKWSFNTYRRLKNVIVILDWIPDLSSLALEDVDELEKKQTLAKAKAAEEGEEKDEEEEGLSTSEWVFISALAAASASSASSAGPRRMLSASDEKRLKKAFSLFDHDNTGMHKKQAHLSSYAISILSYIFAHTHKLTLAHPMIYPLLDSLTCLLLAHSLPRLSGRVAV
tara:strand:- start:111 stop:707 length:597 start_codon:yes stop_codon:yes gene_type:complete